jgi:hypothetical protein
MGKDAEICACVDHMIAGLDQASQIANFYTARLIRAVLPPVEQPVE